ncbi:VOC family protein [Oceanobacillus jeddahense]|uniref:VOC family protein n=1 Tax=Oceanobacillus jeddahense TaxID=1462527 RepID=A0ABY5JSD0_9BACI|nr:VOC family protein [Oceanobacillus jeddahense]UUI02093.1 VOC family protein [Oceanobacillus jeddahense]
MKLRLELFVHNIEKSVEFYHDILEFNIPKEINEDYVPVRKGDVVLGLAEMKKLPDHHPIKGYNQQIGLGVEVVLEVEDVENVYHGEPPVKLPPQNKE